VRIVTVNVQIQHVLRVNRAIYVAPMLGVELVHILQNVALLLAHTINVRLHYTIDLLAFHVISYI